MKMSLKTIEALASICQNYLLKDKKCQWVDRIIGSDGFSTSWHIKNILKCAAAKLQVTF